MKRKTSIPANESTNDERLRVEAQRAVTMLRKALADRKNAQVRVLKHRARCQWLIRNGAKWKREWFTLVVPEGLGE